ncbi:hypothetical protein ABIA33_001487 [Streptacidiphilus sp. MAP12-16]|uniref:transposase n=1 Tax=Streptacidiphilus sp. MAP12-16 TaxID=3156300 RepID=UPI0035163ED0
MTHDQSAAAAATVAHERHLECLEDLMGRLACCFPRRETRGTFRELAEGLLMELEDVNCWTLAEAIGHPGPHRLQHLPSRARWDDRAVLGQAAAWAVELLDDGDGVLIADETGDAGATGSSAGVRPRRCWNRPTAIRWPSSNCPVPPSRTPPPGFASAGQGRSSSSCSCRAMTKRATAAG